METNSSEANELTRIFEHGKTENPMLTYKISCMASYNNMTPEQLMECAHNDGIAPDKFMEDVQQFWQTMVN
jgi:hypothetical protein